MKSPCILVTYFFTLNRAPAFSFPRDIQTEVLNGWYEARENRDNIIKLNVGSGKTLVGLLLLQSSLNERKGPALYVSPDNQLSLQVMQEANALGINVTDDPRDPDYAAGEISPAQLWKLRENLRMFSKQLVYTDVSKNASQVAKRLVQFEFSADTFVNGFSIPVRT